MMFVSFSTWRPCLGQPGALVVVNLAPLSWSTWRPLLGALVLVNLAPLSWSTWRPCLGQPWRPRFLERRIWRMATHTYTYMYTCLLYFE